LSYENEAFLPRGQRHCQLRNFIALLGAATARQG
jgi:hypothetical protein